MQYFTAVKNIVNFDIYSTPLGNQNEHMPDEVRLKILIPIEKYVNQWPNKDPSSRSGVDVCSPVHFKTGDSISRIQHQIRATTCMSINYRRYPY